MYQSLRRYGGFLGIANTLLFAVLAFLYLYSQQDGLLYAASYLLFDGAVGYSQTLGAIVITALLLLLHYGLLRLYAPFVRSSAWTFMPETIVLTLLTSFDITPENTLHYGASLPFCIVAALIFVGAMTYFRCSRQTDKYKYYSQPFAESLWKNLLTTCILFMFLNLLANNDKELHAQIRMEQCLNENDYSNALSVAKALSKPNGNITMLTIYALSCEGELGEKLFEYPIVMGSRNVLPQDGGARTIFFPEEKIFSRLGINKNAMKSGKNDIADELEQAIKNSHDRNRNAALVDYLLCCRLLNKELDAFVEAFIAYGNTALDTPKHYQEALVQYVHTRSNPKITFKDAAVYADFQDFQRMERKYNDPTERRNRLQNVYGNTYWYYFFAQ